MSKVVKLQCPEEGCLVSCGNIGAARQHALVRHGVYVDLKKGSTTQLLSGPATTAQLERARLWNEKKTQGNRTGQKRDADGELSASETGSTIPSTSRTSCLSVSRSSDSTATKTVGDDKKKTTSTKTQEEQVRLQRRKEELEEATQRFSVRRSQVQKKSGVSQQEIFSSAGEAVPSISQQKEAAAKRRHLEAQKHAASSVPLSVAGVRPEQGVPPEYIPTPIPARSATTSVPEYDWNTTSLEMCSRGKLVINESERPQDILALAAAVAGVVVPGSVQDTPQVPGHSPPGRAVEKGRLPSAVSSSTDIWDDDVWNSDLEEINDPVAIVVPRATPAATAGEFADFSEADEARLISLAKEQAPAWRVQKNCDRWAAIFPGRDPAVIKRRYALILKSWEAYKPVNDLVLSRDGKGVPGHTFSATTLQALARFSAQGVDE